MKTILISGASSGIGKACALQMSKLNCNLILCARRKDRLQVLAKQIELDTNSTVFIIELDVRDRNAVQKAITNLPSHLKQIDILLNNAGLAAGRSIIQDGDYVDWDTMIDTNIKGLLYLSEAVTKLMIDAKNGGHIINISSIAGKEVYPAGNVYCATKHAVDAISKAQRIDLVEHGIKVTNIAPGAVDTEFSLVRFKGDKEKAKSVYDGFTPLSADDVASTILFAATTPAHVCLNDITIMPTAQASATVFSKK